MLGATFSITAASHEDLIEVAACKGVAKNLSSFPLASQIVKLRPANALIALESSTSLFASSSRTLLYA